MEMTRAFAALRTLVYMTGFVFLWGWLALMARGYDRRLAVELPAWTPPVGVVLMAVGGVLVLACGGFFSLVGRGTPAPFDPPREVVPVGPYRFVRNPMYVGALWVLTGFALYERSVAVLLFTLLAALLAHLLVVLIEEPGLEGRFGESYRRYKTSVPRWLPRWPRNIARRTVPYDDSRQALYHPEIGPSLFPGTGEVSEDLICAEASRLVYKKFETDPAARAEVEDALRSIGFEEFEPFNEQGSQAFAAWSPARQTVLVAFRGTEQNFTDFATDLKGMIAEWEHRGGIHGGFLRAFLCINPRIEAWLEKHPGQLLLTGHSLGAALATLAASFYGPTRKPVQLVTFGSPRVGNSIFLKTLRDLSSIARYVDCCDFVTRVPPPVCDFQHVGAPRYIDRFGVVTADATEEFIRHDQWLAREEYFLTHFWKVGSVKARDFADHAPINYVYALRAAGPCG
jgi:protein-S-isoprenylcysteine O-methyltransferase Ste14